GSLQATPGHADGDHHELERRWKKATFPNARPLRKSRFEDELGATSPALPRRARQPVPKSRDEVVVRQLILPLSVRRRVRADVIDRALDRSDEVELAIEDLEETIESPVRGVEPALVPELGVAPAASLEVDPGRREESLEDRLRRPLERLALGDGGPRTEAPVEELDDDALLPTELLERLGHPRVIAKHLREHAHLNAGDLAVLRERFDDGVEKLAHLARRQAGRDAIVRPSEELEHAPRVIPREEIDEPDVLAFDHRRLERMEEPRRREPKIVTDEKDSRDVLSIRLPQRGKELGALDLAASSMEPLLRLVDHEEHPRSRLSPSPPRCDRVGQRKRWVDLGQRIRERSTKSELGSVGARLHVDDAHPRREPRHHAGAEKRALSGARWTVEESDTKRARSFPRFDSRFPEPHRFGKAFAIAWPRKKREEEIAILGRIGPKAFGDDRDPARGDGGIVHSAGTARLREAPQILRELASARVSI